MKKKRGKRWSVARITNPLYPGVTVRIQESRPGGRLSVIRMVDGKERSTVLDARRTDLGATPKEQIEGARKLGARAIEELATAKDKTPQPDLTPLTLGQLADKYKLDHFARTTSDYRRDAVSSVKRVAAFIGEDVAVEDVKPSHLAKYMAKRIEDERGPAGYRDLEFLGMACGWAMGEGLIDENPLASKRARKAMKFEHEVSRPVATREYFDKLMAKADQLPAAFAVLLTLAWHTGRRFSAILVLKWEHIDFDAGTIRWYAGVSPDNKKREHVVHMNQPTRDALKTWGKGKFPKGWIFPSPDDAKEPLGKDGPKKWLRRAETLAELPHVKQGGWHMFRRGWVSARAASGMPLKDIQAAGDWNDFDTMMRSYVHETAEGVKTVATFVA